ncbi:MAG TPA: hypothetical protein EYN86_06900 [Planctomycetes bacterium]|nr:hypothetical protein [Planctomycetota bacterium]
MTKYPLVSTLCLIFAAPLTSAQYNWNKTSFPADSLTGVMGNIIAHPTDANTIFQCTTGQIDPISLGMTTGDGLWVSHDAGTTWSVLADSTFLATYAVSGLAICRDFSNIMYASTTEFGIFKTADNGQSWTAVNSGLPFPNTNISAVAIAVNPTDPDRVYTSVAQTGGLDIFNLAPSHPGFFISTNGGTTWASNNSGLPARSDSLSDGKSRTGVATSILVIPQAPNYVLLGMIDLHVNTVLLIGSKNATSSGRVFYSSTHGNGLFGEIRPGLPYGITQGPQLGASVARISSSTMILSCATGSSINVWATHTSITADVDLVGNSYIVNRSKGPFNTTTGIWNARNGALPYINNWTDPASTSTTTIKAIGATTTSAVAVGTGPMSDACLVGTIRSDMGNAGSNNTKIFGSLNSGATNWISAWDSGLDVSPTLGYTEANAGSITFNADMTYAFASVTWSDAVTTTPLNTDNGIYRVYLR